MFKMYEKWAMYDNDIFVLFFFHNLLIDASADHSTSYRYVYHFSIKLSVIFEYFNKLKRNKVTKPRNKGPKKCKFALVKPPIVSKNGGKIVARRKYLL